MRECPSCCTEILKKLTKKLDPNDLDSLAGFIRYRSFEDLVHLSRILG
jgi:hypothetical protein